MKNYDLSDSEYLSYLEGLCLANLPIEFYGEQIKGIKVRDVLLMGEHKYNKLINPFRLSREVLDGDGFGDFKLLDILALPGFEDFFMSAIEGLMIFFNTTNIQIFIKNEDLNKFTDKVDIVINNNLFINRDIFDELSDIILKLSYTEKMKKSTEVKEKKYTLEQIMSIKDRRERDYQLAIYEKAKKEEAEVSKIGSLYNIYNYISAIVDMDYNKPLEYSVYQIYNTLEVSTKKEKYEYDMKIAVSGMCSDVKKLDLRPLNQRIIK